MKAHQPNEPYFNYKALADQIEKLLARRRDELNAGHPRSGMFEWYGQREWTINEMEDVVFGSFKHMKKGSRRYAPARPKIGV